MGTFASGGRGSGAKRHSDHRDRARARTWPDGARIRRAFFRVEKRRFRREGPCGPPPSFRLQRLGIALARSSRRLTGFTPRPPSRRQPRSPLPGPGVLLAAFLLVACDSTPTGSEDVAPADCSEAVSIPELAVGEGFRISGAATRFICPDPPSAERQEFLLSVHLGSGSAGDTLELRVQAEGTRPPGAEPELLGAAPFAVGPPPSGHGLNPAATDLPPMDHRQHMELRQLERRELEGLIRPGAAPAAMAPRVPAPVPQVGDLLQFNTQSQSACQDPLYRTGRVRVVSNRALVVADTLNPPGGFTTEDYQHLAATFDTLVAPLAEEAFGTGTDIDGNGRVILFYTQEVNRLSSPGGTTIVSGFFFARDLFPTQATDRFQACPHSNEAEILYLLVPDPNGVINGNVRTVETVRRTAVATLAHELQHLINSARRLHVVQATASMEEIWLNEGLSHMAEELLFYRASGLTPGQNLDVPTLQSGGGTVVNAINQHQLSNALRLRRYMDAPASNSPYNTRDLLPTRGAAWHFLRYAADRRGGSQITFLRDLVDGPTAGVENLGRALGGQAALHEWLADWGVAIYADSRVEGLAPRYRDRSWNHASIYRHLDEQEDNRDHVYPIRPDLLPAGGARTRTVLGGGTAYFRFALDPGVEGHLELTAGGRPVPSSVRATLVRLR